MEFLKEYLSDEQYFELKKAVRDKGLKIADLTKGEYVGKGKFDALKKQVDTLSSQLTQKDKALNNADNLKAEIARLQGGNIEAKRAYEQKITELSFNHAFDDALKVSGAKNPKVLKSLLDVDAIKLEGSSLVGLDAQLEAIRISDSYLFDAHDTGDSINPSNAAKIITDNDKLSDEEYFNLKLKGD